MVDDILLPIKPQGGLSAFANSSSKTVKSVNRTEIERSNQKVSEEYSFSQIAQQLLTERETLGQALISSNFNSEDLGQDRFADGLAQASNSQIPINPQILAEIQERFHNTPLDGNQANNLLNSFGQESATILSTSDAESLSAQLSSQISTLLNQNQITSLSGDQQQGILSFFE